MRILLSLLVCFGLYSSSKAQIIDVDFDNPLEYPCINLDSDFYDIRSNVDLSTNDYNLISDLDNSLHRLNLYPRDCYMFRFPNESVITFRLNNGFDRTYVVRQKQIVYSLDAKSIPVPKVKQIKIK